MMQILPINKFKSRKEWEAYVWKNFVIADLVRGGSPKEIDRFLAALLTSHERRQMINRIAAVSLLQEGKSYREIENILWLSPTTISAICKGLREEHYQSSYSRKKNGKRKK